MALQANSVQQEWIDKYRVLGKESKTWYEKFYANNAMVIIILTLIGVSTVIGMVFQYATTLAAFVTLIIFMIEKFSKSSTLEIVENIISWRILQSLKFELD